MAVESGVLSALEAQGMRGIGNDEAMLALDMAVRREAPAVVGVFPVHWDVLLGPGRSVPALLELMAPTPSPTAPSGFVGTLVGLARSERRARVHEVVRQCVRGALRKAGRATSPIP